MRQRLGIALSTLALAALGESSSADATPVTSRHQACLVLKRAAVTEHLSTRDLTGRYYCECGYPDSTYFQCALRYRVTFDEKEGSNLIGWFAVRRSDGRVFDWDINEDKAVPLAKRPPFQQ